MDARRTTMTPMSSRRTTIGGVSSRVSISGARMSISEGDDARGRQGRKIRDKGYQCDCADAIVNFLINNEYESPISQAVLTSPSLKEFQRIFRFIAGFIDPSAEFGVDKRFGDDVVSFIRGLRYPHASEINKSQLLAITPHTWPALLSMLAWLVELCGAAGEVDAHIAPIDECNRIFYEYVYSSYSCFMENRDDGDAIEEELEERMRELNQEKARIISVNKKRLAEVQNAVAQTQGDENAVASQQKRISQIDTDMRKLVSLTPHQKGKMQKYTKLLAEVRGSIEEAGAEVKALEREHAQLERSVSAQQIKPEDVEEMNKERNELAGALGVIKRDRLGLMETLQKIERNVQDRVEEVEKLLFDLGNIKGAFQMDIGLRKSPGAAGFFCQSEECSLYGSPDEEYVSISEFCSKIGQDMRDAEEALQDLREQNSTLEELQATLQAELKAREDKMKGYAQIYVEKKEAFEESSKQGMCKMDKMEKDLMRLEIDSENSLFESEQNIERLKIQRNRLESRIAAESAEAEKLSFIIGASLANCKEMSASLIKEFAEKKSPW